MHLCIRIIFRYSEVFALDSDGLGPDSLGVKLVVPGYLLLPLSLVRYTSRLHLSLGCGWVLVPGTCVPGCWVFVASKGLSPMVQQGSDRVVVEFNS